MVIVLRSTKPGKAAGPSEVYAEMISFSEEAGITMMMKLRQRVLDAKGIPHEWQTSVFVPIFKENEEKST